MSAKTTGPLIRALTQSKEKLNILCMDTHERYQINLAATGHNFFSVKHPKHKLWNEDYGTKPRNYTHVSHEHVLCDFMHQIDIDVILSQHKFGQYQFLSGIAQQLDIPLVSLEHTVPPLDAYGHKVDKRTEMHGDIDVYLWNYSVNAWNRKLDDSARIIYHGFDTDYWQAQVPVLDRKPKVLTVVNDFINRDKECGYTLWESVTKDLPRTVYGSTPGLSEPAKNLVGAYNNHQIYINTSIVSSLPMSLIEAAACGCAIVTTPSCAIPEIFTHGENCLMGKTAEELRQHIAALQADSEQLEKLAINARKCILEKLPLDKFVNNWNETFRAAIRRHFA